MNNQSGNYKDMYQTFSQTVPSLESLTSTSQSSSSTGSTTPPLSKKYSTPLKDGRNIPPESRKKVDISKTKLLAKTDDRSSFSIVSKNVPKFSVSINDDDTNVKSGCECKCRCNIV